MSSFRMQEKPGPEKPTVQTIERTQTRTKTDAKVDDAYYFLTQYASSGEEEIVTEADIRKIRRKVDRRIIPLLLCISFVEFLDKSLLGYAMVMGLPEDLKLHGDQRNNCVTASIAGVKGYDGLLTCRILLGFFNACINPAVSLILSRFYRRDEQALRFGYIHCTPGLAGAIGGLVSFGFQNVHSTSLNSWRIMFLTIGSFSIVVASIAMFFLPSTPMSAKFLTIPEKRAMLHHIASNATGVSSNRFSPAHMLSLLKDPQMYMLALFLLTYSASSGLLSPYAATLIKGLGYTSKQSALLHIPNGVISVFVTITLSYAIRRHWLNRVCACLIGFSSSLAGACMLAYGPTETSCWPAPGGYMADDDIGHLRRTYAVVVISIAHGFGSLAGPYAVRKNEAPVYMTAKNTLVGLKAGLILMVALIGVYYFLVNKRRDRIYGKVDDDATAGLEDSEETWADLTDQERKPTFRYVY
ncbi:unnamed protein product [Zymoseptoria tritici ST99CH_1E4]|uniref:Major facilitator superfamily (MFS) profile domain-containing protein n=1 Tax=Zymoseptoria tritici ST99CH_1E4 TaxID=1276532 RepID=A0A2H1GI79_ZYMTR|nr:unnamed protein product [Zymoseptoria tritici ST99CH_1E4]